MSIATLESPSPAKPRKRTAKATRPQVSELKKAGLYLSPETFQRLEIASVMEKKTLSELADAILKESDRLKRYVVSDRGKGSPADQATQEGSAAA